MQIRLLIYVCHNRGLSQSLKLLTWVYFYLSIDYYICTVLLVSTAVTFHFYCLCHAGFGLFVLGLSEFHLVELSKSFEDAKTYCRDLYSDLATVHNFTDMNKLIALASNKTVQRAWIGLEIGKEPMWHWTSPDQVVSFQKWDDGNPLSNEEDACAAMDEKGVWFESTCGTKRSFVCHGELHATKSFGFYSTNSFISALKSHLCRVISLLTSLWRLIGSKLCYTIFKPYFFFMIETV